MNELLSAEITKLVRHFEDGGYGRENEYVAKGFNPSETGRHRALRLDFATLDNDPANVALSMAIFIGYDLGDLLHNGDTSNRTDPILSAMDGTAKFGRSPVDVRILSAQLWFDRERDGAYEYTLFLRLYLDFG